MRRPLFYGWVIVAVTAVVVLATAGVRAAPGAFLVSMQGGPGGRRERPVLRGRIGLLVFGLSGPMSGRLMAAIGIRAVTS